MPADNLLLYFQVLHTCCSHPQVVYGTPFLPSWLARSECGGILSCVCIQLLHRTSSQCLSACGSLQDDVTIRDHWCVNGTHYQLTRYCASGCLVGILREVASLSAYCAVLCISRCRARKHLLLHYASVS